MCSLVQIVTFSQPLFSHERSVVWMGRRRFIAPATSLNTHIPFYSEGNTI